MMSLLQSFDSLRRKERRVSPWSSRVHDGQYLPLTVTQADWESLG